MVKVFKWVIICLLGAILVVVAALLLFIQTNYARQWGTKIGLGYAHKYLYSTITMGEVKGNLLTYIELNDLAMSLDSQQVVVVPRVQIYYSLLSLLHKGVYVDSVIVDRAWIRADTYADSSWNFVHLYKSAGIVSENSDTSKSNFNVDINHIIFQNTVIESRNPYSLVPKRIDSLYLEGNFKWNSSRWGVNLKQLSLKAVNPNIAIRTLKFDLESQNDTLSLRGFALRTTKNFIETDAFYSNLISYGAAVWGEPIDVNEIQFLLPTITLAHKPTITFNLNSTASRIVVNATAQMGKECINASLAIGQKQPSVSNVLVNEASIQFSHVIPNHWSIPVDSTLFLSGRVDVHSRSLTTRADTVFYNAVLDSSAYNSYCINSLSANGYYVNAMTRFSGKIHAPQGGLVIDGVVSNIGTTNQLDVKGSFTNLSLQKIDSKIRFTSDFNGRFNANGSFPNHNPMVLTSSIFLKHSVFDRVEMDSAVVHAFLANDTIRIDTIQVQLPFLALNGCGMASFKGAWRASVDIKGSIQNIASAYTSVEVPSGNLLVNAQCSGILDSLDGHFVAEMDSFKLDSVSMASVLIESSFKYHNDITVDSLQMECKRFIAYGVDFDTIVASGSYYKNVVRSAIFAEKVGSASVAFTAQTHLGSVMTSHIQTLRVRTQFSNWYNNSPQIDLSLSNSAVKIDGFYLKDERNPDFLFNANGTLSLRGEDDFKMQLHSFDLLQLFNYQILSNSALRGIANLDLAIKGNAAKPIVNGSLTVDGFSYSSLKLKQVASTLTSNNQIASLNFVAISDFNDSLFLEAQAPVDLSVDSSRIHFNFPGMVHGRTWTNDINLENISTKGPNATEVGGSLFFDIGFNGYYNALVYKGMASLKNGLFINKRGGIHYNNIYAKVMVDSTLVSLDTLSVSEGKGSFWASGWARFDKVLVGGKLTEADVKIWARNYGVVRSKKSEVVLDANFQLKSKNDHPTFEGDIRVLRSSFFIPAFLETDYTTDADIEPLLVRAQNVAQYKLKDSVYIDTGIDTISNPYLTNLMQNLTGTIRVDIPKNTWLKSETSKIELNGQLFVVKKNSFFEILGKIEVTRGQLVVYGRKFVITSGTLDFQGGKAVNPLLNISTEYVFRTANNVRKTLTLTVSNYLDNPSVSYALDGSPISASDAYSYIIFGSSVGEIGGGGGQFDLAGSVSSEMVSKILSNQLSQTIGETFNLDIIEINTLNDMQNMAFTVGKYITKDLFVTFQKGFGNAVGSDIAPDQLTLEYEINKNLFFRLQSGDSKTSGADFILKFEH